MREPTYLWKPGPPPKTKEEREAAARKYNLIPEDYECYPEDQGLGDYPKLPYASMDSKDPYEPWDHYYDRRNYGEPLHIQWELITSEVHDPNREYFKPWSSILKWFLGSILVFGSAVFADIYFDLHINSRKKPKQWPGPEKVHYTFEPAE
ncbi:NADH dehydrogenase [ubiquinone] 1 beta subcomplex subunit 8: mitochondrial-like protein [Dinothrombium tinctorium]|uniref:NADH dehydrogenase [ubiquinone] 1 beta subcomplex subunit 8: mitochondrial-like protein n=1 Tax=Dinothrombium tinctorium TaxID=1965070 RepID=A0A443RHC7_9ACAR|nr:NADH dehydrogenase [ubiquinone] 1 beta subcomplex subunit 8: mitochondrial-like protein [Dinothrombium tinctorium]